MASMKRTAAKIDDEVDAQVRHEAERPGVTFPEEVREAVELHLPDGASSRIGGASRRRIHGAGAGSSGRSDISDRFEENIA